MSVDKEKGVNLILNDVTSDAQRWVKYVISPVFPAAESKKSLFGIYESIRQEGSFKAVALFFHILSELGMEGIGVKLAFSVTKSDTVSAEELFLFKPSESSLKKLQSLSLRLGLAKVFFPLETAGTEVEDLKTALGNPSGDKTFCQIFTALENSKEIANDDYRKIEEALESCKRLTDKGDLREFFDTKNPFLGKAYDTRLLHANMTRTCKYDCVNLLQTSLSL